LTKEKKKRIRLALASGSLVVSLLNDKIKIIEKRVDKGLFYRRPTEKLSGTLGSCIVNRQSSTKLIPDKVCFDLLSGRE